MSIDHICAINNRSRADRLADRQFLKVISRDAYLFLRNHTSNFKLATSLMQTMTRAIGNSTRASARYKFLPSRARDIHRIVHFPSFYWKGVRMKQSLFDESCRRCRKNVFEKIYNLIIHLFLTAEWQTTYIYQRFDDGDPLILA